MFIGCCRLECYLPGCASLKDKRMVLRSLFDRLRHRFNVAVAEVDGQDLWQRCTIGVSTVNSEQAGAERSLAEIIRYVEGDEDLQVLDCRVQIV